MFNNGTKYTSVGLVLQLNKDIQIIICSRMIHYDVYLTFYNMNYDVVIENFYKESETN